MLTQQPTLHGINESLNFDKKKNKLLLFVKWGKPFNYKLNWVSNTELNLFHNITYTFFIICILYTTTFLPYGRFYNRIGGNLGMLAAYLFVFCWLAFSFLRKPILFDIYLNQFIWLTYTLKKIN